MLELRIAVVGAGLIGRRHIGEIRKSRSCALASVVDVAPGAASVAREAGVPLFRSLEAMLAQDRPDGVILATPNALHAEQGLACVAAGVPVLVEKPLAHAVADGERLCEAAERAGAKILVGHHRRHGAAMREAAATIRSGVLGPIVAVMGSAVFYKPETEGYFDGPNAWRRQPGGGPVLINMIHEVDSLRALVGEIVEVQAFASSATRGYPVEDTVAIGLRFANGALGSFMLCDTGACAKSWEQTTGENAAYPHYGDEDAYNVVGTMGSLGVPTMRLRCYERADERSWFRPYAERTVPVAREDPLANQIEHFAAVIRGEAQPLVGARDGLANLRVAEAIAQAARSGHAVAIHRPEGSTP